MDEQRHPWVRGQVTVPRAVLRELETEAVAAYGREEEACGYLTGPLGGPGGEAKRADRAHVMPNLANRYHQLDPEAYPRTGRTYFLLDARKFQRAIEEGEPAGRPVKVLWHSHLDVGAYFSETDAAAANMGGEAPAHDLAYLVTSVRHGVIEEHRLFIWGEAGSYVEATLVIEEE